MNTVAVTIEELHAEMKDTRAEVLRITGIRDNDLNDMVLDGAIDWLKLITHNDARALEYIPRTREFWGFWRKTWHNMDMSFIDINHRCPLGHDAASFYYFTHRITPDNMNVINTRVKAHYHILRSIITTTEKL